MKHIVLIALTALLAGCSKPAAPTAVETAPVAPAHPVPEIAAGEATGEKLDPAIVQPSNPGFVLDVNGDGVPDFIQLRDNTLYFKDRQTGTEVTLLVVHQTLVAYSVRQLPNHDRPSLLFWDVKYDGYVQHCVGVNSGVPYFGNVEGQ